MQFLSPGPHRTPNRQAQSVKRPFPVPSNVRLLGDAPSHQACLNVKAFVTCALPAPLSRLETNAKYASAEWPPGFPAKRHLADTNVHPPA